jgi:hypothetical protein
MILSTLSEKGFKETSEPMPGETVLEFQMTRGGLPNGFSIRVYTSVVDGVARGDGEDAIRVTLIWRDPAKNSLTPISKSTRVNRTGEMEEIVERVLQRGRDLWTSVPNISRCNCGAPKAVSKAGKLYCAARCWITE